MNVDQDWGKSIYIMGKNAECFVRLYWLNKDANGDTAYLDMLYVDYPYRKQGIGRALMLYCDSLVKEQGSRFCCLHAKKDSWLPAWYKAQGYKPRQAYDKDHIWLKKDL